MESGARSSCIPILSQARAGDDRARNDLIALMYEELRKRGGPHDAKGATGSYAAPDRGRP